MSNFVNSAKENKMNIATLAILGLFGGGGTLTVATKGYVNEQIVLQTADTKDSVDRILELQTAERIDKILAWRCMNSGNTTMDDQLRDLEAEYRAITGVQYQRPGCDFLLGAR